MGFPNLFGGKDVYVSPPAGADLTGGTGTLQDPLHSVAAGIEMAAGGGTVHLRGGVYIESVEIERVCGSWLRKIVVRPYKDEEVTIDSLIRDFLEPTDAERWEPVAGDVDEYVWTSPFPATGDDVLSNSVTRGAFLDREPYARLITYDRLGDLRAPTQLFPKDLTEGNRLWKRKRVNGVVTYEITPDPGEYRPWVYMGPGIWFDSGKDGLVDTGLPATRKVHIRLSHTTNQFAGVQDYAGETDPRELRLALSLRDKHALFLVGCKHLQFQDLTLRFGEEDTIRLRNCTDIVFDHVQVRAASRAVRFQSNNPGDENKHILFKNCELDGGAPPWLFRSDRKDNYFFGPDNSNAPQTAIHENKLGSGTTGALISSGEGTSYVTVHHCEFVNGHDIFVFGNHMRFHHNWVNNINDDALAVAAEEGLAKNARIYQNVITKVLTALSFGVQRPASDVKIFRNLIDLREPTAGIRPAMQGENKSLRQGHFWKGDNKEGPFDLWNNTCLVLDPGGRGTGADLSDVIPAGFEHYGALGDGKRRRAFNNIFVAVFTRAAPAKAIAFLPRITFDGPTDGNTYHQVGPAAEQNHDRFLVPVLGDETNNTRYIDLGDYLVDHAPYEQCGRREDPQFVSFDGVNGRPAPTDDLRLKDSSTSRQSGVRLPNDLWRIDARLLGVWVFFKRDRGCYRATFDRLNVGVNGRRRFPPA